MAVEALFNHLYEFSKPLWFRPELVLREIRDSVTQGRFGFTTLLMLYSTACYVNSVRACVCVYDRACASWPFQ